MICHRCEVPMTQYKEMGGGDLTDTTYATWEIKVCPVCDDKVLEHYLAKRLNEDDINIKEVRVECITAHLVEEV